MDVSPVEPHVAVVFDGEAAQQMTANRMDSASKTRYVHTIKIKQQTMYIVCYDIDSLLKLYNNY
jgi:hypothetical protein